jgi:S1-C subfamily serine protease
MTNRIAATMACVAALVAARAARGADESAVAKSVVKVFATTRRPEPFRPWLKGDPAEGTGTGVVIDGKRVLTAAHVVRYSTQVLVQADQSGEKVAAKVKAIAPDIDLAVLTLDDDAFFDDRPPLPRAPGLPRLRDVVLAQGFPTGGETLSITKGIVSRVEFDVTYYGAMALRVQIDAAINPGNSGGPATVDGRMVGLIFSRLQQADNIGYIVPNEEVDLFLKDIEDGRYDGKPMLWDVLQDVQNEALRARLKLPKDMAGMLVWRPDRDAPAYPLRRWDVITKIGDFPIDLAGKVQVGDLRLDFRYALQKVAKGGKVKLGVFREGKAITVEALAPDRTGRPLLMPYLFDDYPSYMVWGPLVFSTATEDFVHTFDQKEMAERWYPFLTSQKSALLGRRHDLPSFEGEQLVILAAMLPHKTVRGYNDPMSAVVGEVDGVRIKNLRHLAETLRDARGDQVVVSFLDRGSDVLVLDRKAVLAASEQILSENGIRKAYSDDLKGVLGTKD